MPEMFHPEYCNVLESQYPRKGQLAISAWARVSFVPFECFKY